MSRGERLYVFGMIGALSSKAWGLVNALIACLLALAIAFLIDAFDQRRAP